MSYVVMSYSVDSDVQNKAPPCSLFAADRLAKAYRNYTYSVPCGCFLASCPAVLPSRASRRLYVWSVLTVEQKDASAVKTDFCGIRALYGVRRIGCIVCYAVHLQLCLTATCRYVRYVEVGLHFGDIARPKHGQRTKLLTSANPQTGQKRTKEDKQYSLTAASRPCFAWFAQIQQFSPLS
jgi:hypothetical protein